LLGGGKRMELTFLLVVALLSILPTYTIQQTVSAPDPPILTFSEINLTIDGITAPRYVIAAQGSAWQIEHNVPLMRVTAGGRFAVIVRNNLTEPTSLHPHGLTISLPLDGVPFLSTPPIQPGSEQLVAFNIPDGNAGTYWIHSHYGTF